MSGMLDASLDNRTALEAGLLLRVQALEADNATLRNELDGLAKAVYGWIADNETELSRAGLYQGLAQVRLRVAEVLGLEGMAEAARKDLAGQGALL